MSKVASVERSYGNGFGLQLQCSNRIGTLLTSELQKFSKVRMARDGVGQR